MAEPLVLLPGMMCDARLFTPQIEHLSAAHAVMVAPLAGASSVTALAAQVLAQAPPTFALAGLSMGGIVAMEVVKQAPERVRQLALLDTNPLAEPDSRKAIRAQQISRVKAGELRTIMRDEMKPNYLADGPNTGAILDLCMAMAESLGAEVFCQQSIALRDRPDQCDTLRTFTRSALVICGEDDQLCPIERHELICDLLPQANLRVIRNAGHLPTLEQPDTVTALLSDWLMDQPIHNG